MQELALTLNAQQRHKLLEKPRHLALGIIFLTMCIHDDFALPLRKSFDL
jgi:hypothetical protein